MNMAIEIQDESPYGSIAGVYSDWYSRFPNLRSAVPLGSLVSFHVPVHVETAYVSTTEGILPAIHALRVEVAAVRTSLVQQQALMEKLLALAQGAPQPEIELEEMSDVQARARILDLFTGSDGSLFYDEIAERLRLPLRQTVEICNQLESEGLIAEPATAN